MELRNHDRSLDPGRLAGAARTARQGMEKAVEEAIRTHSSREGELRAAQARIERARAAHVAQLQELREQSEARRSQLQDRIELSETGRLFAREQVEEPGEEARADLVASLKAAYGQGDLNSRERIERAAQRLLAGE